MKQITTLLTSEELLMLKKFQEYQEPLVFLIGFMDALKIRDLKDMQITMDIDHQGVIKHTTALQHSRWIREDLH